MYNVKSGYQAWVAGRTNNVIQADSMGWNNIRRLHVPYKLRTFLWRFCNNTVPVRNILRSRGVRLPISCPMCDVDVEHLLHIFFDCSFAVQCWQIVNLFHDMHAVEFAPSWLLGKMSIRNSKEAEKIAMVLWGIWYARNQKVWEGKVINPSIAMTISKKQVEDWQGAQKTHQITSAHTITGRNAKWVPPPVGWKKLNVDAFVVAGEQSFGLGLVLRNEHGHFLMGKSMRIQDSVTALEAEARGVEEALQWLEEHGWSMMQIESDAEVPKILSRNRSHASFLSS